MYNMYLLFIEIFIYLFSPFLGEAVSVSQILSFLCVAHAYENQKL